MSNPVKHTIPVVIREYAESFPSATEGLEVAREIWGDEWKEDGHDVAKPSQPAVDTIVARLQAALFPRYWGPADLSRQSAKGYAARILNSALNDLAAVIRLELASPVNDETVCKLSRGLACNFADALPVIRTVLGDDADAASIDGDGPRGFDEVMLCCTGMQTVIHYRLAHVIFELGLPLIARMITERARARTGIDIHPAAVIGKGFSIVHGTGVSIGSTARIGEKVRLHSAVRIGGWHPNNGIGRPAILEDRVVIHAGTTVPDSIIVGAGAVVGGNLWLVESVPPNDIFAPNPRPAAVADHTAHPRLQQQEPQRPMFMGGQVKRVG